MTSRSLRPLAWIAALLSLSHIVRCESFRRERAGANVAICCCLIRESGAALL